MSSLYRLGLWPAQTGSVGTGLIVAGTAIATATLLSLLHSFLWPTQPKIVRSPLRTVLPKLSQDELDQLEYKPDHFPGARDVETPYGSIRVYEWGPLTGDKVLFVHGISTSCITLTKLANALVNEKGCRVMLFDLFGRGFSDNPADLPHDARLYTTQILLALASSPDLAWTGPQAFKLVGYSMGGGIAVHFAASFPHLVSSVVLLAPAGLIRPESFGTLTRAVFTSGLVPPRLLAWITRHRLKQPIRASSKRGSSARSSSSPSSRSPSPPTNDDPASTTAPKPDPITAALAEATSQPITTAQEQQQQQQQDLNPPETSDPNPEDADPEPRHALEQRVLRHVHWQLAHHAGFVSAFMSCIRHAPLTGQHAAWARLLGLGGAGGSSAGAISILLGEGDEIIEVEELMEDVEALLMGDLGGVGSAGAGGGSGSGSGGESEEDGEVMVEEVEEAEGGKGGRSETQVKVRWSVVPGGHDFPMTFAREALREMYAAWGWA